MVIAPQTGDEWRVLVLVQRLFFFLYSRCVVKDQEGPERREQRGLTAASRSHYGAITQDLDI